MLTSITEVRLARCNIRRLFACVLLQTDSLHFARVDMSDVPDLYFCA